MSNGFVKFNNFEEFCIFFSIEDIVNSIFLKEALTHSSVSKKKNYERLEFLGDTILNFCVSKMLFEKFRNENEGILSKKKSFLISRKVCRAVAKNICLDKIIILSKRQNLDANVVLADVLESFLAVVYYEYGMEKAWQIVQSLFFPFLYLGTIVDPKSYLQELMQQRYKILPQYSVVDKVGKENAPIFRVSVSCAGLSAFGNGKNKKSAECDAAMNMINILMKKS